jgi:hypothetical protein
MKEYSLMLRPTLILLLISASLTSAAQSPPAVHDSLLEVFYKIKWFTTGVNYDVLNRMPGVVISNGFDERPLIHFEDMTDGYIYKLNMQTNFTGDYSFGGNLLYQKKRVLRWVEAPGVEYLQRNISSIALFQRDANLLMPIVIRTAPYRYINFLTKIGYQQLNNHSTATIGVGYQKTFYRKVYAGALVNYHFKYISYNLFLQGFIVKSKLSLRATYDKIDKYDFLNLGLHFSFRHFYTGPWPKH